MRGISYSNPHKRGRKWCLLRRGGPDDPPAGSWLPFETEEEATDHRRTALRRLASRRTIEAAREEYLTDLRDRKKRDPKTIDATRHFLRNLFPQGGQDITEIGPRHYYRMARSGDWADATHRRALAAGKGFCTWMVSVSYLKRNPLDGVEPEGEAAEGKEHLTQDEAVRWAQIAYRRAAEGSDAALALLGCLLLGLRPTEAAAGSLVRDLDAGGTILWVTGKSSRRKKRPRRKYPIHKPELATYRALLLGAARDRDGEAPLLRGRKGAVNRQRVYHEMHAICDEAGVPRRCPHSLRTTHANIRLDAGEGAATVARSIGNTPGILLRHYGGEAAAAGAGAAQVARDLVTGPKLQLQDDASATGG